MAATDPVRQIVESQIEQPLTTDIRTDLKRLAMLQPSSETPYLTLILDWRLDQNRPERRPGRVFVDQHLDTFFESTGFKAHTPEYESLKADIDRIHDFVDGEVDHAAKSVIIFASSASGVFETVLLGMPLDNAVSLDPTPALRLLVKLLEEEPRYAVLAADQRQAMLTVVDQAAELSMLEVKATDYPRKQAQGGWSQHRFQMRADERVEAFARTVAEKTREVVNDSAAKYLVLAGEERITTTLRDNLHPTIQERIAGVIHVNRIEVETEVISASMPVVEAAERTAEETAVGRLENGAGPGGGSVIGVDETLDALQTQQVMTLVMNDDFTMSGWADFNLPLYGMGEPPAEHPGGGDPKVIVPVRLEEEVVRLALLQDAEVEIVPVQQADDGSAPRTVVAQRLDSLGGIGAILRFSLAEDQTTAELQSN